jgi:hypothetical protein
VHDLAAAPTILNISGITTLLGGVLLIIVLTVAIRHMMHAHRGNYAAVLTGVGIVGLAALVWALATGNEISKLGADLVSKLLNL